MKRLSFAMLVAVSACASAPKPQTPAEMLLGQWSCEVTNGDLTTKGDVTYLPDGKATIGERRAGGCGAGCGDRGRG